MKAVRHNRPLIAWTLYLCVLVNLLACGIAHGQAMGLRLSGIDGMSCSLSQAGAWSDGSGKSSTAEGLLATFKCPVCAGAGFSAPPLLAVTWLPRPATIVALPDDASPRLAPRHVWPSANPRASPHA